MSPTDVSLTNISLTNVSLQDALWWLSLNILSAIILAFYSMEEMACMSFNRIRLHYYVSMGMQRAIWLNSLLKRPAHLFGTTLFCVNLAMFIGSEFGRRTYSSLGLNPDLAPITQVIFIVIFAELAPMFAARRYAEHVALLGAPILYFSAKLLAPILWSINLISRFANRLTGGQELAHHIILNQEDVQNILDTQDEDRIANREEEEDVDALARNIFNLRHKDTKQVMQPLNTVALLSSQATVQQARALFLKTTADFIVVYHRNTSHIIGIVHPRNLIRLSDTKRISESVSPPWFITQYTPVIQILKEFRRANHKVAVVLNDQGLAIGVLTLDDLTDEIFGEMEKGVKARKKPLFALERTFPGDMKVADFNREFGVTLSENENQTLNELLYNTLGHHPTLGESITIPPFELTVAECSLTEVKKVTITTQ